MMCRRLDPIDDLFGGSGTTLIACEKSGRLGRLIELEARYCDVAVSRWEQFTNKQAVLENDGRTFHAFWEGDFNRDGLGRSRTETTPTRTR